MSQTVLIIGVAGFIGSHVAARLCAAGFDVVGLASRRPADIPFARFHIGRSELVGALTAAVEGCDTVVFAGGASRPGSAMRSLGAEIDAEAGHLLDTAEICATRGTKRFVFVSSGGAVYGPTAVGRIPETHPTQPISSYGLAKLVAEHGLRLIGARTGMKVLSMRIANPFGPGQIVKGAQGFVAALVQAARTATPLEIWGDGRVVRDFIYIDDMSDAFVAALRAQVGDEIINIGSGTGALLADIVALARELSGRPIDVEYKPPRAVDVPRAVLDISKAHRLLGWRPTLSLRDGLRMTLMGEGVGLRG